MRIRISISNDAMLIFSPSLVEKIDKSLSFSIRVNRLIFSTRPVDGAKFSSFLSKTREHNKLTHWFLLNRGLKLGLAGSV